LLHPRLQQACGPGCRTLLHQALPNPPRLQISFTPIETAHLPAREQREEELRLRKRGGGGGGGAGLAGGDSADIADRQPAFLKDKGDALFKQVGGGGRGKGMHTVLGAWWR
jgi:hypothetical protein